MNPLVVEYIRDGKTWEDLVEEHAVVPRFKDGLVSLCYDQIRAKHSDTLANQCRGIILDAVTLDVVAYPFDRFFNAGEPGAADIDWESAVALEKLDGTLLIVYWFKGQWNVGTRRDPTASSTSACGLSFRELAEMAAKAAAFDSLQDMMAWYGVSRMNTYMFELTGPENQVVVEYDGPPRMTLLGVRAMSDMKERQPGSYYFHTPWVYPAKDLASVAAMVEARDPRLHEGVVVRDKNFSRVKVKSSAYVFAHRTGGSLGASWKSVVEVVLAGRSGDVYPLVANSVKLRIREVESRLACLRQQTEADYAEIKDIILDKDFAQAARTKQWPHALFSLRRGLVKSVDDMIPQMRPTAMVGVLGLK